jgi:hypothetical protein
MTQFVDATAKPIATHVRLMLPAPMFAPPGNARNRRAKSLFEPSGAPRVSERCLCPVVWAQTGSQTRVEPHRHLNAPCRRAYSTAGAGPIPAGPSANTRSVLRWQTDVKQVPIDLCAIRGWRQRFAYALAIGFPPRAFMLAKYPEAADRSLAGLHLRRMADFLRRNPGSERT